MGEDCHQRQKPLPNILKDSFTDVDSSNGNWLKLAGAKIDKICQVIASGKALHFIGVSIGDFIVSLKHIKHQKYRLSKQFCAIWKYAYRPLCITHVQTL